MLEGIDVNQLFLGVLLQYGINYSSSPIPITFLYSFGVCPVFFLKSFVKFPRFPDLPCWAVGQAVTAMAGQNIGAGDMERVRKTTKTGLRLNLVITLMVVLLVQTFAGPIILLFDPANPEVTAVVGLTAIALVFVR